MLGHYLMFNKNCDEAIKTYQSAFNAEILEIQKYGDMPPSPAFPITDSEKNLILHAKLAVCGSEIMCADGSHHCADSNNMYVSITSNDKAAVTKAWEILKQNGKVYMELEPSFFAILHGSLQDKFGINWMFTVLE